jgi:hypothetical protein
VSVFCGTETERNQDVQLGLLDCWELEGEPLDIIDGHPEIGKCGLWLEAYPERYFFLKLQPWIDRILLSWSHPDAHV